MGRVSCRRPNNSFERTNPRALASREHCGWPLNSAVRRLYRMRSLAGVIVASIGLLASCSSHKEQMKFEADAKAMCEESHPFNAPIDSQISLSSKEACWLRTLSARGNYGDKCLADCIGKGKARPDLSGCMKSCEYLVFEEDGPQYICPWQPPSGWEQCKE